MTGGAPIRVLCVDDEPGMADLIGEFLERADDRLTTTTATSAREGLRLLDEADPDCVVSDYDMAGADGLVFLESVRSARPDLPFVLFTGHGSEEIASEAVSAGVTDYVQKETGTDQYRVLARRIRNAVARYRAGAEAAEAERRAETILDTSPDAVVVTVGEACEYANPAAVDLLGVADAAALRGRPLSEFFPRATGEHLRAIRTGEIDPTRLRRTARTADGRSVPVEVTARRIPWGGETGVVSVVRDVSDRIERERELAYRQSLIDSLFELSPNGLLITDDAGEVLTYNERFADLWGLSPDLLDGAGGEWLLDRMTDRVADADLFARSVERQIERPDADQRTELRLVDGTVVAQHSASIPNADGERVAYGWVYNDITEVKALERRHREAFDRMTDAVYALDDDWRFTFLNDEAGRLLRREDEKLVGANVWEEFPEAVDSEIHDRYHEAIETGEPVAFETHYEPLDTEFEIRAFPSETGLTAYFRDVSERRRVAAELRENVEALQRLYAVGADSGLSFEAKQDRILDVGTEYLGLPYGFVTRIDRERGRQTIVAATGSHDLLQPGETCPLDHSYCQRTIEGPDDVFAVSDADDRLEGSPEYQLFELAAYIGVKFTVGGEPYGTVCFAATDPRERAFSESERTFVELMARWLAYEFEERDYRERLEAKNDQLEEFASIVSHDLRNPLNVAVGRLELLREERGGGEHLDAIDRAHDRIRALTEDVLTLAREGKVVDDPESVDLGATAEECWRSVETADAELVVDTDRRIVADGSRLTQLLENLFRNAVEHGGPDVTVTVDAFDGGFSVEDDGVGFQSDERERLFDPGYSTKRDGTGLGLRIVSRIADAHDWSIAVTEGAAGGARFEITGVDVR